MISPPFIRKGRRGRKRAEQGSEVRDETAREGGVGGWISQVNKGHYEDFSQRGGKQSCRSLFVFMS